MQNNNMWYLSTVSSVGGHKFSNYIWITLTNIILRLIAILNKEMLAKRL